MAKTKVSEEEIAATFAALPEEPPDGFLDEIDVGGDVLLYKSDYVFSPLEDRRVKMAHCHCTACGEDTYLEQVSFGGGCSHSYGYLEDSIGFIDPADEEIKHTGNTCICPNCGKGLKALHVSRFRYSFLIDSHIYCTIHNVRGHICFLSWLVENVVDKAGNKRLVVSKWDGALFVGSKKIRVTAHKNNMGYSEIRLAHWERRVRYSDNIGAWDRDEIVCFDPGILRESDAEKSALEDYIRKANKIRPCAYLELWNKYPNVENLVRQGFTGILQDVMEKCCESGYNGYSSMGFFNLSMIDLRNEKEIDFKAAKPHQMLKVEKSDLWIAKKYKTSVFLAFRDLLEIGYRIEKEQLDFLQRNGVGSLFDLVDEVTFNGYKVPPVRLINYVKKQYEAHAGKAEAPLINFGYIRDYWDMLYKVYKRMEPSELYPKDIVRAHDNMVLKVDEIENAEMNRKMLKLLPEREKLSFEDPETGLVIFAAPTHASLIKEGKLLHHCVARYAASHASGKTTILFIRHIDDLEMPFFTLEYDGKKVVQNRGNHNCSRTPEVEAFEKKWLKHIKEIENGKYSNNRKIAGRAGA